MKGNNELNTSGEAEEYEYYDEEEPCSFRSEEEFKGYDKLKIGEKYFLLKQKYKSEKSEKEKLEQQLIHAKM